MAETAPNLDELDQFLADLVSVLTQRLKRKPTEDEVFDFINSTSKRRTEIWNSAPNCTAKLYYSKEHCVLKAGHHPTPHSFVKD